MPIAKPYKGENKVNFINRCILELSEDGVSVDESMSMCQRAWSNSDNDQDGLNPLPFLFMAEWARRTFKGIYNPNNLPQQLFEHNYLNTMSGVGFGFGLPSDFPTLTDRFDSALKYRQNISFFSGAKTFQQQTILSNAVFNDDGSKRSFKDFREIAERHNIQYNVNFLKTEQNGAFRISQSAEQWHQIQEVKEIFPYLQYVTIGDGLVRPQHAAWDGILLPVDHPWWDTHFPPADWGCRCTAISKADGKQTDLKKHLKQYNSSVSEDRQVKSMKNPSKVFNVNSGKSGLIYGKGHPYFDIPSKYKKSALENFGFIVPFDDQVRKTMIKVK